GCQEGYKAGSKEALDKYQVQLDNARQVVASAHTESRQVITKTRDEIVDLAVSIAASIVKYSIDTRDEGIIEMVKVALQRAEEMKMILFRCSPKTILMLKASEHEFKAICPNAVFSFIEDKSVNDMGCIIETEEQVLDLEIDGQLQKVTDALRGMGDNNEP
ncbi:MAG TPA: FliH/SctL family protein, partial [Bacillota bacterium]|nr:FliH/SctL family protein [Bacillota bacterium]